MANEWDDPLTRRIIQTAQAEGRNPMVVSTPDIEKAEVAPLPQYQIPSLPSQTAPAPSGQSVATPAPVAQAVPVSYQSEPVPEKKNPIKGLIDDILSTVGESSSAAGVVESQRYPGMVQDWKYQGQRYYLNPQSNVRPDIDAYLKQYPSKLESIQGGTKFGSGVAGEILNPLSRKSDTGFSKYLGMFEPGTRMFVEGARRHGGEEGNKVMDWAAYVSSRGLETGLGIGGGTDWQSILKGFTGIGGGGGGGQISQGSGVSGAAKSSGGGGFSIGPWGYVAGALIGVINGIWEWNDATKQDEAAKKQAQAEYIAAVKEWEANQNKARGAARLVKIGQEKAENLATQQRTAQSAYTKKAIFSNLINQAANVTAGGQRTVQPYQVPGIGG